MHHLRRSIATCLIVLVAIQATGCHSWTPVTQPVAESLAQHPTRKVKVLYHGGGGVTADSARIDAATLIAYLRTGVDTIPLSEVKEVRLRQSKPHATVALVLVGALAAFVVGGIIACVVTNCMYE